MKSIVSYKYDVEIGDPACNKLMETHWRLEV